MWKRNWAGNQLDSPNFIQLLGLQKLALEAVEDTSRAQRVPCSSFYTVVVLSHYEQSLHIPSSFHLLLVFEFSHVI